MIRFLATDLWREVRVRAKKALRRRAVIAYVTDPEPFNLGDGDVLVTDATHHAISSGQTSAKSLATLFENGVEIHSCPGLHAKLVVLDDVAIASSGNLSGNSLEGRLIEAGVITDHPTTVSAAINFIERLREETSALSRRQILSLLKIPVTKKPFGQRSSSAKRKPPMARRPSVWLANFYSMSHLKAEDEAEAEEGREEATKLLANPRSEAAWVYYSLKAKFPQKVKPGDQIIWLTRPRSSSKRPVFAHRHSPVVSCKTGTRYRFVYYESSPKAEAQRMRWGAFKTLCARIGLPFKVGRNTERTLQEEYSNVLNDLWQKSLNSKAN
jgi:hypothetical protein